MQNNRNFILAIALSIAVLFGWQYFVAGPQVEKTRQRQAAEAQSQAARTQSPAGAQAPGAQAPGVQAPGSPAPAAGVPAAPEGGVPSAPGTAPAAATREQALGGSARLAIDTPSLSGSIDLRGARFDDLRLKEYHETVDPKSPTIVLLSPSSAPNGYFAEFGWIAGANGPAVPGPETVWTAPAGARLTAASPVTLTWANGGGLTFRRTIAVDEKYMFTVRDTVENGSAAPVTLYPYGRVSRFGEPTTAGYYILHEGPIGVLGEKGLREDSYSTVKEKEQVYPDVAKGWLGITDKYWAAAIIPDQGRRFEGRFSHRAQPVQMYQADFRGVAETVAAGATAETTNRMFAGAKQVAIVDGYRDSLGIDRFDLLIDWGWFYFITKPVFYLIDWLFRQLGNFGVAILIVTVIVKAIFFPLANKSYKSMSAMKKLQPEMVALRERFKDDKVKQQQALMELYKKEKINPIAGCWPVLLQIPVFFALYKVLFVTIEMRHAPFFGWIQDLSAPDPTTFFNLFGLIPWTPPHFLMLGIWPLIMGVTMWVQMRLNPTPTDPAQQMVFNWMPVLFTFMLASFPAGLVIYWAWNNTLSVIQQAVIMRRQGVKIELIDNVRSAFQRKPKKAAAGAAAAGAKPANTKS